MIHRDDWKWREIDNNYGLYLFPLRSSSSCGDLEGIVYLIGKD
jgi:hypothetical protein